MAEFKVGDKVRCIDDGSLRFLVEGGIYTVICVNHDIGYLDLMDIDGVKEGGFYPYRFELVEPEFKPEYFSALNERDAEKYIGKLMEFANRDGVLYNNWGREILKNINNSDHLFPFKTNYNYRQFMRTCPETFEASNKKSNSGLIEALGKSIQQWELMLSTGKSKEECYAFLGGERIQWSCFLCDYCGYDNDYIYNSNCPCNTCINWGGYSCHYSGTYDYTVFTRWRDNESKENTLAMLDHLKSELNRLENENKI